MSEAGLDLRTGSKVLTLSEVIDDEPGDANGLAAAGENLMRDGNEATPLDGAAPRAGPRAGAVVEPESDAVAPDEPDEPDDPPEPVVSANAIGIAATAEPTPNATANAPTRPT